MRVGRGRIGGLSVGNKNEMRAFSRYSAPAHQSTITGGKNFFFLQNILKNIAPINFVYDWMKRFWKKKQTKKKKQVVHFDKLLLLNGLGYRLGIDLEWTKMWKS